MTPHELAVKLVDKFNGMTFSGDLGASWLISEIELVIGQALEEARQGEIKRSCESELKAIERCEQIKKEAIRGTFLDAAEIAESYVAKPHADYFAQEYRNLCMEGIALKLRQAAEGVK